MRRANIRSARWDSPRDARLSVATYSERKLIKPIMEAWYALYTKPHCEARVARALVASGFSVFLPLLPARLYRPAQPLFPTYLFVRCDPVSVGSPSLQWIPGLRRILSLNGRPAVVPDRAIECIRAGLHEIEAAGGLPRHPFKPGDEVVVEEGPLTGLRGVFQGPVGPSERVHILLRFLGQANRAEVPAHMLRAVPDQSTAQARRRGTRGGGRHVPNRAASRP
jgi:transcriptional antiterminator RfaH